MSRHYILKGGEVVATDLLTWGRWYESIGEERVVVQTQVGPARVSTVFLGLDHGPDEDGRPVLWETLVFGGPRDAEQWRYTSREAAEKGHAAVVALLEAGAA